MATATKNNRKTALLIGGAAAGLTGLYLLTRGSSSSSTDQTDAFSTYGGFTGGGFTEGTAIGVTDKGTGTDYDINALLEGINNLNAEQAARQQELYNQYLRQIQTPTTPTASDTINPTPYGGGSAADEIADRVSNPGGSATKLTDLERALRGYDLDMSDINAIYGTDTVKFTTEGIYQILPGGGLGMAGGASNAYQPYNKSVSVTRTTQAGTDKRAGTDVITVTKGNQQEVYSATGEYIGTMGGGTGKGAISAYKAELSALTGGSSGTAKTQSGGTTSAPSSPAPTTASTSPSAGSIASTATSATPMGAALNAVTGGGFSQAVSSAVNAVSSFIGGLFK